MSTRFGLSILLAGALLAGACAPVTASTAVVGGNESATGNPDIPDGADPAYPLVDTGQTACYDDAERVSCPSEGEAYFGQDAQYSGLQPAYQDNGDGTITDLNTGLMWIQDAGAKVTYAEGVALAQNYSFAGYDDWRLPTIKELYSLMDFSGIDDAEAGTDPFIDTDYFVFQYGDTSAGDRAIDSQWMTSTINVDKVMNNQECFFGVNFADGRIKCYPTSGRQNKGYFMRLVRGAAYGENDFVDNGDGTISDLASGLMWQQDDAGEGMDWPSALETCEMASTAGYDDWRLPNAKELQSIVDYSRSPGTTNSAAIDPLFNTTGITNEAGQADYAYYWTSTTHEAANGGGFAAYISFGRAIGMMNDTWMDVHGAGAQRSDPKTGDEADFPYSFGPQGDARRLLNEVRCVRGGVDETIVTGGTVEPNPASQAGPGGGPVNLAAAAAELGVSERELQQALGAPPPDLAAAAAELGVTIEDLQRALGLP
ncbi:MAG: hypothetical protein PWQ55_2087 [Chloroflexota bacterium]|nr:hypothetical protein [Chloroflexota bacterium]